MSTTLELLQDFLEKQDKKLSSDMEEMTESMKNLTK